jgi:hypothetical protein
MDLAACAKAMRQRPESDIPRGCRTATLVALRQLLDASVARCERWLEMHHQITIAEMLIGVKKNLSKLSARFVVCLVFRLRCDIS